MYSQVKHVHSSEPHEPKRISSQVRATFGSCCTKSKKHLVKRKASF